MDNVMYETSRTCRKKEVEYLKDKIYKRETSRKNRSIRDLYRRMNEFRKGYQPVNNLIKMGMICLQIPTVL
jgi:hypothetical protein